MYTFVLSSFCVALLVLAFASAWRRRRTLGVTDVFLLAIALFFGAYTLVDVSVNDIGRDDALVLTMTFLPIGVTALALWVFARGGPVWVRKYTSLEIFRQRLIACPNAAVLCALG